MLVEHVFVLRQIRWPRQRSGRASPYCFWLNISRTRHCRALFRTYRCPQNVGGPLVQRWRQRAFVLEISAGPHYLVNLSCFGGQRLLHTGQARQGGTAVHQDTGDL